MQITIARHDKKYGPYTIEELSVFLASGQIQRLSIVLSPRGYERLWA